MVKRTIVAAALLALAGCGAGYPDPVDAGGAPSTCPRDLPQSCPEDAPGYDGGIAELVRANCLICHAPGGISQDIPLGSYAQLHARRRDVLGQVYNCLMPQAPQPPLSSEDRKALLAWLVCGAPDD